MLRWLSSLLCGVVLIAAPASAFASDPLPARDDVVDYTLPNGLRVVLATHPTPAGRVVMRLVVRAGSLDEADNQRGVAHFIEHMAFHGSTHFPGDSARAVFQSLGMELGKHQSASSTFDHTTYTLDLPRATESVLNKGFSFLADALDGLTFPQGAIDTERHVILQELLQADSPEQRLFQRLLPKLTPGSWLGKRLPRGVKDSIQGMTRDQCLRFYHDWYTPGASTLIVAGDLTPSVIRQQIQERFASIKPRPTPPRQPANIAPFDQTIAIVQSDPELPSAVVAAIAVDRAAPPTVNSELFRDDLIDQLVRRLMSRRLEAHSFAGKAAYTDSGAYLGNVLGGLWLGQLAAFGPPDHARDMLADLVIEVERARRFGFTAAELELAQDEILTEAGSFAQTESTLPSRSFVEMLSDTINAGGPLLSGDQNLALIERLLPSIGAPDVSDRFTSVFGASRLSFLIELPDSAPIPSESRVLNDVNRLAAAPVDAPLAPIVLDQLIDEPPAPVGLKAVALDSATGVMTIQLANSVVVHHRSMDQGGHRVTLRLTIAGGEIEEDPETRGLTRAAAAFFDRPATSSLTGLSVRDFLTSRGVEMRARTSFDAVTVTIKAPADEAETSFQLLHLALTDPVIESAAMKAWKNRASSRSLRRLTRPRSALETVLVSTIYPATEDRVRPLSAPQIERLDTDAAQHWLTRVLEHAPLELSIVGEIDRRTAADLTARYLGSLPPHPAVSPGAFATLRHVDRAPASHAASVSLKTQANQAVVAVGFVGPDASDTADARVMDVVERIVRPQLIRALRDEQGLVSSLNIINQPARALPGFGLFLIVAPTSPAQTSQVAGLLQHALTNLALGGPGQYDVAIAQSQLATASTEAASDPAHWSRELADLNYRGRSLADLADEPIAHRSIQPQEVRQAMAKYLTPDRSI